MNLLLSPQFWYAQKTVYDLIHNGQATLVL